MIEYLLAQLTLSLCSLFIELSRPFLESEIRMFLELLCQPFQRFIPCVVFNLEALIQRFHLLLDEQFEGLEATTCVFFEFVLLLE